MVPMYYRGRGYITVQTSSVLHIQVNGMTCDHCERNVERALRGVGGVRAVLVDRVSGAVDLDVDAAHPPALADLAAALHAAAYEIGSAPAQPEPASKSDAVADFAIAGMTCASCVSTIERRLAREPGVASASVNLATERARVRYDRAIASPQTIAAAVADAGYRASELSGADGT